MNTPTHAPLDPARLPREQRLLSRKEREKALHARRLATNARYSDHH